MSTIEQQAAMAWAIGMSTGRLPGWLVRDPDVREIIQRDYVQPCVQVATEIAAIMQPVIRERLLREELLWRYPSSHADRCHRRQPARRIRRARTGR